MPQCATCSKKQPKLNTGNLCKDCFDKERVPDVEPQTVDVEDGQAVGEITFGQFKQWMKAEIHTLVQSIVVKELESTKKEFEELKKENKTLSKKLTDAETKLNNSVKVQGENVNKNTESCKNNKTVTDNNLKYLINLDRNARRKNVMFFGVPEDGTDVTIDGITATSDSEKRDAVIRFMGIEGNLSITDFHRLGAPNPDKVRPMKIGFLTKETADSILSKSSKLKDLKNNGMNIYVKPDKTKSEQNEFQRLGKKKEELLLKYPTEGDAPARVTLAKGSLKVDGVEVDKYEPKQTLF